MEHVGLQFTIFKGYINVTGLFICKAYRTHTRVGRNIEIFFRYYWTSVLEFFSVFNNIEISVLNIFNIQYYWTVLLRFSVIPKSRKSFKNPEKFPKKNFKKILIFLIFFFFFNIKHFWYWIPKNTAKYRKIPKNTKKYQRILKILKKNITKQKNYSTKFSSSETSVFSVLIPKFRYYWTSILEFFQYSIILKFRYWTFSVFNIIEHRYFPVFSVFRDPDPHPNTHTANRPKSEAEAHLYRSYFLQNPYFSVRLLKLRPMTKMGFFISNYFINKISHGKNQFVEKSTFLELHICL